jgi:Regulator of chromosome condensation (RCC1) repeat
MRFTRRLIERRSPRTFVILASAMIAGAGWSCASDEEATPTPDPLLDTSLDAVAPEGGATEDVTVRRDAGFIDAAPPPVVCASSPCAIALVTSASNPSSRLDEGYCALMQDGTVVCWGSNASGQLGRGEEAGLDDSATPARVITRAPSTRTERRSVGALARSREAALRS